MPTTTRFRRRLSVAAVFAATWYASGCGSEPSAPGSDPDAGTFQLEAITPTQPQGTVATPVDPVPTLIVKTPSGQPVSGIGVSFSLAGGAEFSGSVSNPTAVTNAQGIATPGQWILGTHATTQGLIATLLAEGPTRSVTFRVESTPAAPAQLFVHSDVGDLRKITENTTLDSWGFRNWSADRQVGLPNWEVNAPAIWVTDKFGNRTRVSGVLVRFVVTAGRGQLAKTEVRTDSAGYASAEGWTLGPSAGLNAVVASAPNLDGGTITATALDPRELTWYDLDSVENRSSPIKSGSVGLSGNGYFVAETFYGELGRRWLGGTYRVSAGEVFFGEYTGSDVGPSDWYTHTLVNDRLSIVWCPPWYDCGFAVPPAEELRKYSKRKG